MYNTATMPYSIAMTPLTGDGNNGFGGDGAWWIIILFLFAFCGWGGNWGGNGAGYGGVSENYTLISDMGQLERKIDTVNGGLCDGFYSTAQLINGVNMQAANNTAALTQVITAQGYDTRNAITQDTISNMQGFNGVNAAIKDCCCQTQQNLKDVNYLIATQANGITTAINQGLCQTNFNASTNTRDIIDNQNANTRAILEKLSAQELEAKNAQIAALEQKVNALNLAASQEAQNNYLVNTLTSQIAPRPIPAFAVNPPYQYTGCGCNRGCNC